MLNHLWVPKVSYFQTKSSQNTPANQVVDVRRLRDSKYYESELYWSHQLFVKNWIPESKEIAMVTS
jgi:hypothetical protein